MSSCTQLTDYFLAQTYTQDLNMDGPSKGLLAEAFASVMDKMWSNQHKVIAPSPLKYEVGRARKEFQGCKQQDSQELLLILLDRLSSDLNRVRVDKKEKKKKNEKDNDNKENEKEAEDKKKKKEASAPKTVEEKFKRFWSSFVSRNDSVVTDLVTGVERYTIRCMKCGNASTRFGTYNFLSVDIPAKWSMFGSTSVNLSDCLATYVQEEVVEDVKCDKCKGKRRKSKGTKLETLPDILIIHLKRFKMGWHSGEKIKQFINFPINGLRVNKLMAGKDEKKTAYDLIAVSNHYGGTYGGHYTAYGLNPLNKSWYLFDDKRVKEVKPSSVVTREAYLLFYKRRT
uniref:USP domain-containing protein n=1 Tax=Lotharella oceanica TaxID=641309 RepID=A0A7S2TQU6_9EUKA